MDLTPEQLADLRDDLANGPLAATCAPLIEAAQDQAVADLYNAVGDDAITLATLTKNSFLAKTTVVAVRLALGVGADMQTALEASVIAKWGAALTQARAADPGSSIDLSLIAALGDPVGDGLLTSNEYAALTSRAGSRAEVLFGQDVVLTAANIGEAR